MEGNEIMKRALSRIARDSSGATAVEYGLILSLIVLAMMGALILLADSTSSTWNSVSDEVTEANGGN